MKLINSLMVQFFVGALLLIVAIVALSIIQREASHLQKTLREWKTHADKIQLDIANLQQQGQHYKLNAPRDFESYSRDIAVFYQQFLQQLESLNADFSSANHSVSVLTNSIAYPWLTDSNSPLLAAIQNQSSFHAYWQNYINQLEEQLGNPDEPRLEWGAEFLINNSAPITHRANDLANNIQEASDWFDAKTNQANTFAIGGILIYLLIVLSYFAFRVVRPIIITTRACESVAAGNYGEKVNINGSGETRRLQHAFNELSARSKLMMDMLSEMNQPGDVNDRLQRIYDSGHEALGSNWIGLMAFKDQTVDLNASVPPSLDMNFRHRHVSIHKAFGKELVNTLDNGWLSIESLRQLSLNRHDERFLRELHKNTMATQIVGYSFKCPQHNDFILMFSSKREGGFSQQQIELIKALSKLIADAIIAGMDQPASHDLIAGDIISIQ